MPDGISTITPGVDSRPRMQDLWEYIQADMVAIETNTDQPGRQQWKDFLHGDKYTGTCFYKDFMELVYLSKREIAKTTPGKEIVQNIFNWADLVRRENTENFKNPDLRLMYRGIELFQVYENHLFDQLLVAVVVKKV